MSEYLDTSVIVKWFRREEEYHKESLRILDRVTNFDTRFIMSRYGLLELIRALVKNGFPEKEILEAFQVVKGLYNTGALEDVELENILEYARDIEVKLGLYASDSLHLATALYCRCNTIWSMDKHFFKTETRNYLKRYGIQVKHLSEI